MVLTQKEVQQILDWLQAARQEVLDLATSEENSTVRLEQSISSAHLKGLLVQYPNNDIHENLKHFIKLRQAFIIGTHIQSANTLFNKACSFIKKKFGDDNHTDDIDSHDGNDYYKEFLSIENNTKKPSHDNIVAIANNRLHTNSKLYIHLLKNKNTSCNLGHANEILFYAALYTFNEFSNFIKKNAIAIGTSLLNTSNSRNTEAILNLLHYAGFNFSKTSNQGHDILALATRNNYPDIVENLIEQHEIDPNGFSFNKSVNEEVTAIHIAAYQGHMEVLNVLLQAGADINLKTQKSLNTVCHIAALNRQNSIIAKIMKIVDQCIDFSAVNADGHTAFYYAMQAHHFVYAEFLLNNNIQLSDKDFTNGNDKTQNMAYISLKNNNLKILMRLVASGLNINAKISNQNYSLLHFVAEITEGIESIVNYLVSENNIAVSTEDISGHTPLFYALIFQNRLAIQHLLRHGAKFSKNDLDIAHHGKHLLVIAICLNLPIVISLLIEQGFDVLDKNKNWLIALHIAADYGYIDCIKALLKKQALPQACEEDADGFTAVCHAFHYGHSDCAKLIFDSTGVIFSQKDLISEDPKDQNSLLHLAILHGMEEMSKQLIKDGIDVNRKNYFGETSLHFAVKHKQINIVKLLLSRPNIKISTTDSCGNTPLHHALKNDASEIADLLIAHGANIDITYGGIPLLHALVQKRWVNVIDALLRKRKNDIDINLHDEFENFALEYALIHFETSQESENEAHKTTDNIIALLIHNNARFDNMIYLGAEYNLSINTHFTLLHLAVHEKWIKTIDAILEKNPSMIHELDSHNKSVFSYLYSADIDDIPTEGKTPEQDLIAQKLLAKGAKFSNDDIEFNVHSRMLLIAAANGHINIFRAALSQKADINYHDTLYQTPLHHAVIHGHEQIVAELLKIVGIKISTQDEEESTPLYYAIKHNRLNIGISLLQKSALLSEQDIAELTQTHPEHMIFKLYLIQQSSAVTKTSTALAGTKQHKDSPDDDSKKIKRVKYQ